MSIEIDGRRSGGDVGVRYACVWTGSGLVTDAGLFICAQKCAGYDVSIAGKRGGILVVVPGDL